MKLAIPKETFPEETRVAMTPSVVEKLTSLGLEVMIESDLGEALAISDEMYIKAGAKILKDRKELLSQADLLFRVRKTPDEEIPFLKKGSIHISFLDPYKEPSLTAALAKQSVTAISMEMMPRTTIAQKMDALSSQANLAGYVSVILAAEKMKKIFPMMTTPAGTISPIKVFVIGVGVAGLQAIATAKRLGATVEAFDTRPVVEEQVRSLGARFVKIDLGETGQTSQGYAKALTEEQLTIQREEMAKVCARSDIVITTAQLFGRKAPLLITKKMIEQMKPGSVIVDMATESGGNVEGSEFNKTLSINGVSLIGLGNLPGKVALDASQMYALNLYHFFNHFWNKETKTFQFSLEDELLKACTVTHNNEVRIKKD